MTYGFSCPVVWGILAPHPVIKHVSPALEGGCFTTVAPGKSLYYFFKTALYIKLVRTKLGNILHVPRGVLFPHSTPNPFYPWHVSLNVFPDQSIMFSNLCSLSEPQFKMYPNYYMYIYFCLFVYNIATLIDMNSVMSAALFYLPL